MQLNDLRQYFSRLLDAANINYSVQLVLCVIDDCDIELIAIYSHGKMQIYDSSTENIRSLFRQSNMFKRALAKHTERTEYNAHSRVKLSVSIDSVYFVVGFTEFSTKFHRQKCLN